MLKRESQTEKVNINNVCSYCSPSYSMNTSTDDPGLYTDMEDYYYNSTCEDPNPVLSDTALHVFYYVVFSFGLIGQFNQILNLKNK